MMLSCKNQLPSPTPSPPLERNDQDGLHGEKLYNQSFPSPPPPPQQRVTHDSRHLGKSEDGRSKGNVFVAGLYLCLNEKKQQQQQQTNKQVELYLLPMQNGTLVGRVSSPMRLK